MNQDSNEDIPKVNFKPQPDEVTQQDDSGDDTQIEKDIVSNQATQEQSEMKKSSVITKLFGPKPQKNIGITFAIILAGIGSGFGLSQLTQATQPTEVVTTSAAGEIQVEEIKVGVIYGSEDTESFSDPANGHLKKGGLNGEGSHRLLRPGGPTQTVYLISTVLDLDQFDGHEIKVWGETFAAQQAAWLMDVGRVEVVELNTESPFEEEE